MVKNGTIQATAMQFWLDMVKDAMVAADDQIKTGKKPSTRPDWITSTLASSCSPPIRSKACLRWTRTRL